MTLPSLWHTSSSRSTPTARACFTARRGAIPVKFALTAHGQPTCDLPPATISVIRASGAAPGAVKQTEIILPSDDGSDFRIDDCTYIYNLAARALRRGACFGRYQNR